MKRVFLLLPIVLIVSQISFAQNVGIGTTTPQAKLDVNGDIALRSTDITITSTYNYALDVNTAKQSFYNLKAPLIPLGNFILNGISSSANGRTISLMNRTGNSMEIYNEDIAASAQNRISTGTGATMAVYANGNITLRYDTAMMRWMVLAAHNYNLNYFGADPAWSLTGNAGTTSANFIGTTDEQPLRFRIKGGSAGIIDSVLGNTALGVAALRSNVTGFNNIAIGKDALKANINYAQNNIAIGSGALENNIYAEGHVAIGYQSLQNFVNINFPAGTFGANHNTAVGYKTLQNNGAAGTSNTAVGGQALNANTTGSSNTAIGDFAMWKNTTGYGNVAVGAESFYNTTYGYGNTSIGFQSLRNVTYSENNTAVGASTLVEGGYRCTAIGRGALQVNQASDNVAIGMNSQVSSTSGTENTSCGTFSLNNNISGSNNVAIGHSSLSSNSTGSRNVAMGYKSLAAVNSTACTYSTALGNECGPSSGNYTNSISIGHDSHANGTDRAEIGSTFMQVIGGYKPWTTLVSDGRFKKNVHQDVKGLDFILQLKPVTYTVDYHALETFKGIPSFENASATTDSSLKNKSATAIEAIHKMQADKEASLKIAEAKIQSGFIAQDVVKAAEQVGYDFDGVNKPQHDKDNYSIAYSQFVVPLVKAVQEQQAMIEQLKIQNEILKKQNETILKRLEKLENK